MKKLLTLFAVTLTMFATSCSKSNDVKPNTQRDPDAVITYTIDGVKTVSFTGSYSTALQNQSGAYMLKQVATPTTYEIKGCNGATNAIELAIATDSLGVQTYSLPIGAINNTALIYEGRNYSTFHPTHPSKLTVAVTSYAAGKTSGTFSGTLYWLDITSANPDDSISIAGTFTDVAAVY